MGTLVAHSRRAVAEKREPRSGMTPCGDSPSHGRGGIRTHGTLSRTHTFQACALNHSATRPTSDRRRAKYKRAGGASAGQRADVPTETRADRVRFELTVPLPVRRFSRPV